MGVVALIAVNASFSTSYRWGREHRDTFEVYRRALLQYEVRPDSDLTGLFISPGLVRTGADILRKHRLSAFRRSRTVPLK